MPSEVTEEPENWEYSTLAGRTNTRLPANYWIAHELCFKVHDVMTALLVSGQKQSAFFVELGFRDQADREAFENGDLFDWLEKSRRVEERAAILVTTIFPAVLSDMVHCFYEALETSRKAKLTITFMLLRKPLQEGLFLLESVLIDPRDFAEKMTIDPLKLASQGAGGVEVHTKRIQRALELLGDTEFFDAGYLAQIRYSKAASDGFDGICNKAIHLFTSHKAIQTDPLDINFIFSGPDSWVTQWSYVYSRLPYLLVYIHRIVERVCSVIAPTQPEYVDDMNRRISALILLWWDTVEPPYNDMHLQRFVDATRRWLLTHCRQSGYPEPMYSDLTTMAETGAFPGESPTLSAERNLNYERAAAATAARRQGIDDS